MSKPNSAEKDASRLVHLLIETGRASRLAACNQPFANGQFGSEDMADVTCPVCLALFPTRPIASAEGRA